MVSGGKPGGKAKGAKKEKKAKEEKKAKAAAEKKAKEEKNPSGPPVRVGGTDGDRVYEEARFTREWVGEADGHGWIGEGSYKKVWKARDNDTAKTVAWNEVRTDKLAPADMKRAIDEIKVLDKVGSHKHIMEYHCTPPPLRSGQLCCKHAAPGAPARQRRIIANERSADGVRSDSGRQREIP